MKSVSIKNLKKSFNNLCGPAQFYLVLSLVSLLMYSYHLVMNDKKSTPMGLVYHGLIMIIWTYILNWVCTMKYGVQISWFLVFLPVLLVFGVVGLLLTMNIPKNKVVESHCEICDTNPDDPECCEN